MEILSLGAGGVKEAVTQAVPVLARGGLVIYPTDTAYGIAVNAGDEEAVRKVFNLKERADSKSLTVCVRDLNTAETYATITPLARKLAAAFLPGALTLILEKKEGTSALAHGVGDADTIGIRIPGNRFCQELSKEVGFSYTATSANVSGKQALNMNEILDQFAGKKELIDLAIIDPALENREQAVQSTIVDARREDPIILREGAIPEEEIASRISTI